VVLVKRELPVAQELLVSLVLLELKEMMELPAYPGALEKMVVLALLEDLEHKAPLALLVLSVQ